MYYQFYEMNHAAVSPLRAAADATRLYFRHPLNPLTGTALGRGMAAAAELFERVTRRYGKPDWDLHHTQIGGRRVPVTPIVVWSSPFCRLIHFRKTAWPAGQPRVLIVAPMSGHYATLLRGTVESLLPDHDVYITDWVDARMVPLADGIFDLDNYIDYVIEIFRKIGPGSHVIAVCQPSVPVLAAVALMSARGEADLPSTMTLMGGPIDTRVNPTAVNKLAEKRDLDWFRANAVMPVPFPHPGFMRSVYPGFLQLSGFMNMNLDRHMEAHQDLFFHLVEGDGDSAAKHREFYDEYLAVMDLTAEFYLQTVDTVFIRHALPKGEMRHRSEHVDLAAIERVAMLTVEGEHDDISGLGQTRAAHDLCTGIPASRRHHYTQPNVGHYGVFNGSRFRAAIAPRIAHFIATDGASVWQSSKAAGNGVARPAGAREPAASDGRRGKPRIGKSAAKRKANGRGAAASKR